MDFPGESSSSSRSMFITRHVLSQNTDLICINVKIVPTGKTISLEVKRTDTIDRLKALINEREGIPVDKQRLSPFRDFHIPCKGYATFIRSYIHNNYTLYLDIGPMRINVKIVPTGKTISLEVNQTDTIDGLKALISEREGIPVEKQWLYPSSDSSRFWKGFSSLYPGHHTLDECDIYNNSTLYLDIGPMEVSVETLTGETIILKVERSNTIHDIKNKIRDKVHIPPNQQKLFFGGNQLVDDSTLDDCNIEMMSTLVLLTFRPTQIPAQRQVHTEGILLDQQQCQQVTENQFMQIVVMTNTGKTINLQVKSSETVRNVKTMIQEKEGIPSYHQKLFFAEEQLVDNFTLDDYYIHNNSIIHLVLKSKKCMKIFIEIITGKTTKTTTLDVKSSDTISTVKAKIDDKDGIPLDQQILFFDRKQLNDDWTLAECHIKNGVTLQLMLTTYRGSMQIFINTEDGKTITLEVKDSYTVGNVKTKIEDEEGGVRPYNMKLFYNGQQLDNRLTLADYCVHKESTLNRFVIHRGPVKIYVKAFSTGKTIKTLELQSSDTISKLKALIEGSEGIPTDQQMLLFDGKQLHDHDILAICYIQNESIIYLVPLSKGKVQILIKMPEKSIIMEVESSDIIANLKAKIMELGSIPLDQQLKLSYNGKELDNGCKIADYNIHWNSVLHLVPGCRGSMQIAIKSKTGRTNIRVKLESSDTIGHVKAKIQEEEGLSLNDRSLLFNENLLEDSRTLAYYGIKNNSTLHFVRLTPST